MDPSLLMLYVELIDSCYDPPITAVGINWSVDSSSVSFKVNADKKSINFANFNGVK